MYTKIAKSFPIVTLSKYINSSSTSFSKKKNIKNKTAQNQKTTVENYFTYWTISDVIMIYDITFHDVDFLYSLISRKSNT